MELHLGEDLSDARSTPGHRLGTHRTRGFGVCTLGQKPTPACGHHATPRTHAPPISKIATVLYPTGAPVQVPFMSPGGVTRTCH